MAPAPPTRLAFPEDSLRTAALLAAAGGFLDAFTYFGHGHVFANAMSGNVILLGVLASTGHWRAAVRHVPPIAAFLLGIAAAQALRLPRMRITFPHPALASLTAEIVFLLAAGWFPKYFPDLPLVLGISFLAALQSSAFPRVGKWGYNSTMTTGNLRQFGEAAFRAIFAADDPDARQRTKLFGAICLAFLAGAIAGGLSTAKLDNRALWVVSGLLLFAWLPMAIAWRRAR